MKNTSGLLAKNPARKGKLPAKMEAFIEAITRGIFAAAKAPAGTVNVSDYLDAAQLRMLDRLAQKANQTPRQFLQGIVSNLTRTARRRGNAGGAA